MAGSRKPGPQCSDSDRGTIDDGTMCLAQSPLPGPLDSTLYFPYQRHVLLPLAMTHEQKMEEGIKSAYRDGYLSKETLNQLPSLGQFVTSIIVVGGVLAGLGVAAAAVASTGVGAILEGIAAAIVLSLAAVGVVQSGKEVIEGIGLLAKFYGTTRTAKTTKDLDDAGKEFACGIAEVGVGTLMMILSVIGARQGLTMGKGAISRWNTKPIGVDKPLVVRLPPKQQTKSIAFSDSSRIRQQAMLEKDVGFNVSPVQWDSFPVIGRQGTFVTDQQAILDVLGPLPKAGEKFSISQAKALELEKALGLKPGSLNEGFKIRRIEGLAERAPRSPLVGNSFFLGPGKNLPGGGPEMVIEPIPTRDTIGVKTMMIVTVKQ